ILNVAGHVVIKLGGGMSGAVNMIVNANTLEFKEAGEYAIEVAVDGIQLGSSPLFVKLMEQKSG
ncbi:hypothetical protein RY27_18655, partial [Litorilinea aerophila]